MDLANIRKEYTLKSLELDEVKDSPLDQFKIWLDEAVTSQVMEPNAMNLATINSADRPSSRVVLLKGLDHGFVFYTHYESKKGLELKRMPFAALNFFWPELERQVRVEGKAEKVDEVTADIYFLSRPTKSRIGAWASPQSQIIPDRQFLEDREREIELKFKNQTVRRPPTWGGYRILPDYMEFWQGRPGRLHDRLAFGKSESGLWTKRRLAP